MFPVCSPVSKKIKIKTSSVVEPATEGDLWVFSALCDSSNLESDLLILYITNIKKSFFMEECVFKIHSFKTFVFFDIF